MAYKTKVKKYNVQYRIGHAKYVVNSYSGKKYKDGSDFYDISIFKNKKDLAKYEQELQREGFRKE